MTKHWMSDECMAEFVGYMWALGIDWYVSFRSRSRRQTMILVRAEPNTPTEWFAHDYYPGGSARLTFLAADDRVLPIEIECRAEAA